MIKQDKKSKNITRNTKTRLSDEVISKIDQLSILMKATKGNCIIFALYHANADQELIKKELRKRNSIMNNYFYL